MLLITSLKPVHLTRTVHRWLQRHRALSEQWIISVVTWTEHPEKEDDFQLLATTKVGGKLKLVSIWVRDYSWRYLVYKIHMEALK